MQIEILGTGCSRCKVLENRTREAVRQLKIDTEISKVEDIMQIMQYGVMTTPALVINGKILIKGSVPSISKLKELLSNQ